VTSIISASRRTDIPSFYARWFINRIRAGYCAVPNPFNHKQVSYVSLKPQDVAVIVFWTRNPRPLMPYLDELDQMGFRYYFQFTILGYPRPIETKTPPLSSAIDTFRRLAGRIGPQRVIWRYDPVLFSQQTGAPYHLETYRHIAAALQGHTHRSVVSIMDFYRKSTRRLRQLADQGVEIVPFDGSSGPRFEDPMRGLVSSAHENGMEIVSCAEEIDLQAYGIRPGKCIDDDYIRQVFGIDVTHDKDPCQRQACGCVSSQDIGMYDSCLFGCSYCYATASFERATVNHAQHNPGSPSLLGWHDVPSPESISYEVSLAACRRETTSPPAGLMINWFPA
jgi:hypothetical protein